MSENSETEKHYKKFREYYQDEDFKKKHLAYVKEKVECECGKMVSRCNISNHRKTSTHETRMKLKETQKPTEEILKLQEQIKELKELMSQKKRTKKSKQETLNIEKTIN